MRARLPALANEPMVYAGRLDPMAEGVLLVLTGADRFALPAHLAHPKEYVATFLFGVESDTHDALGRLAPTSLFAPTPDRCADAVAGLTGTHSLPMPVWSAYRVKGRALHTWARLGRLAEIVVPLRDMTVSEVVFHATEEVRVTALLPDIRTRISRVNGDFRQTEALADWELRALEDPPILLVRATVTVTSGTYIRALAQAMGARLGCGALLLALRRTRVGPYAEREAAPQAPPEATLAG